MSNTNKYRKHIARIVLFQLLILFLLSLNFKVWGGTYLEGSLEDIVVTQSNEFNHCLIVNKDANQIVKDHASVSFFPDVFFIGFVTACVILSFKDFVYINKRIPLCKRAATLVSLCIRLDN